MMVLLLLCAACRSRLHGASHIPAGSLINTHTHTFTDLRFYPYAVCTTDAIYRASATETEEAGLGEVSDER